MWVTAGAYGDVRYLALFLIRLCFVGAFALAIWGLVEMGCLRGTAGYNRFGADPLARRPRASIAVAPALR
jgi:uncharacterized membrane protein YhaH (DUF805 family)